MTDLEHFQALQRALVDANFETGLEAWREGNQAVFSLNAKLQEQTPEKMATLSELTTANGFTFRVENDRAWIVKAP
jgi:hypothetical protein